jgi:diguanylate cyclase (GGDEF)-like protein/PAS domain S-box-containing protein
MEQLLQESEAYLKAIIENEPECVKIVDAQGLLVQMNPAGLAMIEAESLERVKGAPVLERVAPEYRNAYMDLHKRVIDGGTAMLEYEMMGLKGGTRWVETHAVPLKVQGEAVHLAVTRDITQRKVAEDQVRQFAFLDALTDLPNRRLLIDRLEQAMAASKRSSCYGALLFLDLDNFKPLNDKHGHAAGDLLLIEVARRLTNSVREVDTVSRFGGDEFVVLLGELTMDQVHAAEQSNKLAEKIRTALAQPYFLSGGSESQTIEHHCSASIGVVLFSKEHQDGEKLLKWVDTAMYRSKSEGRNRVTLMVERRAKQRSRPVILHNSSIGFGQVDRDLPVQ